MAEDAVKRFEALKQKKASLEREILEKESKLQVHAEAFSKLLDKAEKEYGSRDIEKLKTMVKEKEEASTVSR